MYDGEKSVNLGKARENPSKPAQALDWKRYTVIELIRFRDEIGKTLPPLTLTGMNLEEELLLQFHSLRALQTATLEDDDNPLNQRAQVANTVTTALSKLIEMQESVHTQERFKMMESLLIRHLKTLPEATAQTFLTDYERLLGELK